MIHRDAWRLALQLGYPVRRFLPGLFRLSVLGERIGPALERGGLWRKQRRGALTKLFISPIQVFQQDSPGYAVYRQMVDNQQ